MNISEIEPGKNGIEVMGELIDKKEPIVKDTYKVCHFELADDTGSIDLTLWNEDIEKFSKGDKIKISGGYCKVFGDNAVVQLSISKTGSITKVEGE